MFSNEISFLKGINTLLSDGCYDSIFSIARQYLKGYALCGYSIENTMIKSLMSYLIIPL